MRRIGKTIVTLQNMKIHLDKGREVVSKGMKEPEHYLKILKDLGCECTAEPEYTHSSSQEISDEMTGIIYLTEERKVLTGYRFKKI